jgi:hypothetical protein
MKFDNIKKFALGLFLASAVMVGCKEEIDPAANAVQTKDPSVTFAATNAEEQVVPVYADGEWAADCEADWITISPMSGNGSVDVTISVTDNLASDGTVDAPREARVIFRGKYVERQGELVVYQKGDNYRDAVESTLAQAAALEDGKFTKIAEAQVVATASDGFVATDATASMYVSYKGDVTVGDKVFIAGEKVTLDGIASIKAGQVDVLSTAAVEYPSALDLLANLDPAKANQVVYVKTEAGLLGSTLSYPVSVPVTVNLLTPKAGTIDLEAVNMHNIRLEGYFVGIKGTTVNLVVTKVEDLGVNDDLKAYFYDDFSWMKSFLDVYNTAATPVGDAVGTDNPSAEAPNLKTAGGLQLLEDEFYARGYEDLNPGANVIYPQQYYWKFGKTSNHGGIKLPKMELEGSTLINAEFDFDWSPHMTGSGNIDKVSVVVELEGSGFFDNGTKISDPFVHSLQKGDLGWHHVNVLLKGVNNSTRIIVRPLEFTAATPDQQRWHIDNLKVSDSDIPYKDPVYANVSVSEEIVTFEGTPAGPVELKIKSDKDWTLTKGMDSDWFTVDVLEGLAEEEVTVKVTCQPSTSITMRKSTIVLASADTRKTIHVVQSAAGGELDPLISVAGGNLINVDGLSGEFTVEVQSNVDYTVSTDVDWLTVVEQPATRAIVEKRTAKFAKTNNLSGAVRTGHIIFAAAGYTLAVEVKQDLFEPYVIAAPVYKTAFVSGYGCTLNYSIKANVPYTVTTDADWVKLPAAQGPAQDITLPIQFVANSTDAVRTATVTFTNEEYNYSAEYTINQYPSGVVFQEDFSWMSPMIAEYNSKVSASIGDTVGSNGADGEAPNAYTKAEWLATGFWDTFNAMGYENTNASAKVLYPQDAYLKFGKTGSHSGLYLPSIEPDGSDVVLTFNWCAQVQGSGTVDPTQMLVELEGDGVCADTDSKISTPTASTQEKGQYAWQTYTVTLKGVKASTRILIRHNDMTSGKAIRFHLDNIKIVK